MYHAMDALDASTGDVIEIRGKRRTVAKCLPLYPSDEGRGIVRIDGLIRNNAGVAIGDMVIVKKVKAPPAEKVVVAPLEAVPPIDERYLADTLESVPVTKGDNVMIPYFGGRLTFQVMGLARSRGSAHHPEDGLRDLREGRGAEGRPAGHLRGHRRPEGRDPEGEGDDRAPAAPPGDIREARRRGAQGRAARMAPRDGQDAAGQGGRDGEQRPLHPDIAARRS